MMTSEEKVRRAQEITEWLKYLHEAIRFGSKRPAEVADILVYGRSQQ